MAVMISPAAAYAETTELTNLLRTVREERPGYGITLEEIQTGKEEGRA